jgi:small ligand-binding sensory domain FIST
MAFAAAVAAGPDWQTAAEGVVARLGANCDGHRLGFVYATDVLSESLDPVLACLRAETGVPDWTGTTGLGVCGDGESHFDRPAIAVMTCDLDVTSYNLFCPSGEKAAMEERGWSGSFAPPLIVTHGDPGTEDLLEALTMMAEGTGAFLVGGLSAARGRTRQIAGRMISGGLSGVILSPEIEALSGLTQGCSPVGPAYLVTESVQHVLVTLDSRPALEVLKGDIGDLLARDLEKIGGLIHAALPIRESDRDDYLVRNLMGVDVERGLVAISEVVQPGDRVMFVRRDPAGAEADMYRMLRGLKARTGGRQPRGALYFSCVARGPGLFAEPDFEMRAIREIFGSMPLAGFFGNGEISNNRLYGYTGVLTLLM